jgi:SNF2 family DNA or RNA helicase
MHDIDLWPVQQDAVGLAQGKEGFFITDDTGLGKTVTALAIVKDILYTDLKTYSAADLPRILVVCRNPAKEHWLRHIRLMQLPEECFTIISWNELFTYTRTKDEDGKWHVEVTTNKELTKQRWTVKISDESHKEKDRKSLQSKSIRKIKADYRIKLSGTPAPNGWAYELWAQLADLYPKKYTSFWRFYEKHTEYISHNVGTCDSCGKWHRRKFREEISNKNEAELREELAPFTTGNRLKKGCRCTLSAPQGHLCDDALHGGEDYFWVEGTNNGCPNCGSILTVPITPHDHLADLPDKLPPVVYYVDLDSKQRRAYNEMKSDALAWIGPDDDQPLPAPIVIAQLTRLRQFASAYMHSNQVQTPWEVREAEAALGSEDYDIGLTEEEIQGLLVKWHMTYQMHEPSPKLDLMMDLIQDSPTPVVVFSMFRQMVDLACIRFDKADIEHVNLPPVPGDQTVWQDFQNGKGKVFITTIQTGGESIELFRASTVIFLDRSWSPKDNSQAEDRLWRSGQKNAVSIIDIQARDTVDQVVEERLVFKAGNLRRLLGG